MKPPNSKNPLAGASYFFFGIAVIVLPVIYFILLLRSTVVIAQSPVASWWVELWVLVGAAWLLFFKSAKHQNRLVVEISTFIAAALIFGTKLILSTH